MTAAICGSDEIDAEDLGEEDHRDALEDRRAVHAHRAADRQHEPGDPLRHAELLAATTSSAVGSVALLELVENAVISAARTREKNMQRRHADQRTG